MGKCGKRAFENGGNISKADQLIAEMNAKYGVSGNAQPAAPAPAPAPQPQPQPAPQQPQQRGLVGNAMQLFGNRGKQIDKAAGYAQGGLIRDAAEYWADDNARFDNSNPSFAGRVIRAVNPLTGFGSAMGAMHTAAGNGDIPGMAMAGISAIPALGVMRITPASGALKAAAVPSAGRAAGAVSGGAVLNAIADEYQANKPSGYANGGKIEGPGTPTSDSIPATVKETGEEIRVANGERIVSAEQDALLEKMARQMGFESLDQMLEAGTGKPVGPTMKGGKPAAAGGWNLDNSPDEYAKAMQGARNIMSIPPLVTNNKSAQGGIYKDVGLPSISIGAGQAPTIYDNGGLRTNTDRVSGSLPVANVSRINSPSENVAGNNKIGIFDKDPLAALSEVIGKNNAAVDAANYGVQKLYPEGTFDNSSKRTPVTAASAQPAPSGNPLVAGISNPSFGAAKERFPIDAKSEFITGTNGAMPDSSGGGFVSGNAAYTVKPTSQDGISRVTAPGKNPLYTNISPESAVAGLNNQTIGQPADQEAQGIARIANANKIRGEMIDSMIAANGGNGVAILPEQPQGNPLLDKFNSLADEAKKTGRGGERILAEFGNLVRAQMGNDAAKYSADISAQRAAGHDQTLMRGQDLNAISDAARIAGNPLDQQAKQLELKQKGIIAGLFEKANAGDKDALAKYNALTKEPNYSNRYITLPNRKIYNDMGQVTGEEPGGVFNAQTGQPVNFGKNGGMTPQQEYQNAIAAAKGDPAKIKLIQDRARQNGVIQ